MPCTVTRAEELYFEQMDNLKKYGVRELTEQITTRVACELASYFPHGSMEHRGLSELARKWMEIHAKEDEAR